LIVYRHAKEALVTTKAEKKYVRLLARALAVANQEFLVGLMSTVELSIAPVACALGCQTTIQEIFQKLATATATDLDRFIADQVVVAYADLCARRLLASLATYATSAVESITIKQVLANVPDVQAVAYVGSCVYNKPRGRLAILPLQAGATLETIGRFLKAWGLQETDALDLAWWLNQCMQTRSSAPRVSDPVLANQLFPIPIKCKGGRLLLHPSSQPRTRRVLPMALGHTLLTWGLVEGLPELPKPPLYILIGLPK